MGKRRSSFVASDDSGEERPARVAKKSKKGSSSGAGKNVDDEGNAFWELSNKRRIVVQKFKGNLYVNLREFYEDKNTGAMKPSTKGLMLSIDQYQTLLGNVPAINKELRKNGVKISGDDAEADDADELEDADSDQKPAKSSRDKKKKANIEATSDEAEDDSD